jgi:hypothetical protein
VRQKIIIGFCCALLKKILSFEHNKNKNEAYNEQLVVANLTGNSLEVR